MNRNWPRWITASVTTWFKDVSDAATPPLYLYIEGTGRRTQDKRVYAELRIDGPHFTELSKGYWQIDITIDVLVVSTIGNEDGYAMSRAVGDVLAAFTTDIPVFKFGTGQDDDPLTQLGCLRLLPNQPESIIVTNFGQPKIDSKVLESTVEASYRMNLS